MLLLDIQELECHRSTVRLHNWIHPAGPGRFVGLESGSWLWSSSQRRAALDGSHSCLHNGPGFGTISKLEEAERLSQVGAEVKEVERCEVVRT